MKLGSIRAHHFSHTSESHCPLNSPETARHYNTKHILAAKLRACSDLHIAILCIYAYSRSRCVEEVIGVAAEKWDAVAVESLIHPVRPDILLLRAGSPILAIEVRATNAVSDQKAEHLRSAALPWIEIEAGVNSDQWAPGSPLGVLRQVSVLQDERCRRHQVEVAPKPVTKFSPQERVKPSPPKLSGSTVIRTDDGERELFRVVDCYPREGRRVRRVFWAYHLASGHGRYRIRIRDSAIDDPVAEVESSEKAAADPALLDLLLRRYLRRRYERYDCVPYHWRPAAEFPPNAAVIYQPSFMPVRFGRDSGGRWVRVDGRQHARRRE